MTRYGRFAIASGRWGTALFGLAAASSALADPAPAPKVAGTSDEVSATSRDAAGQTSIADPLPRETDRRDGFSLTAGVAVWTGKFGTPSRSDLVVALLNGRYRTGDIRLDVTVPWLTIRSRGTIYQGIDATPLVVAPATSTGERRRSGLGDVSAGVSWLALHQERTGVDLDLAARIKLPTSGAGTGLSTGKSDEAFSAELSRSLGKVTPIARFGYRVFGDPARWNIRNGFFESAGLAIALPRRTVALVSYDYAERTSDFVAPAQSLVAAASAPLGRVLTINAYASAGLSRGAAGFSAGASLKRSF